MSTELKNLKDFCLTLPGAYEDYPFDKVKAREGGLVRFETPVIRHQGNRKLFALFLEHGGKQLLNLKCDPFKAMMWRDAFLSVIAGYHMNKEHWNSVILDGSIPVEIIKDMIADSYELTKPRKKLLPSAPA